MSAINDPEVGALAAISAALEVDYRQGGDPWVGSPFAWIKTQQSRRRGKVGEQLVAGYLAAKGFDVARAGDSEADRLINGHRVEIKFSTLWEAGVYKFQQVRDQDYEIMICLGLCPFDAHCWAIPKTVLRQQVIGKMGQHGGAAARDTDWMSFLPDKPFPWLAPYGGRLADAAAALERLARRSPTR